MSTYVGLSETSVWECPQYCKGILKQDHKLIYMENYAAASHNIMTVLAICTTGVHHKFSTKPMDFITQKIIILLFCEMLTRNSFLFKSTFPPAYS